jgi:hypothetical protein
LAAVNDAYLGTFLFFLHELDGDPAVLDEAEAALRAASAADLPAPEQARTLSMLSAVHLNRYRHTHQDEDLDESVTFGRRAVAVDPDAPVAARLGNLGNALRLRFDLAGDLADLDEAISVLVDALVRTPLGHPDHDRLAQQLRSAQLERNRHPALGVKQS